MGEYKDGTPLPVKGDIVLDKMSDPKEKNYYDVDKMIPYPGGKAFVAEIVPLPPMEEE